MGGRLPDSDSNELAMKNPTLKFLVNKRIKERLVGTFEYTMVGRSFDGGKIQVESDVFTLTAFGFVPTQGGFEINGNKELTDIYPLGVSATVPDPA